MRIVVRLLVVILLSAASVIAPMYSRTVEAQGLIYQFQGNGDGAWANWEDYNTWGYIQALTGFIPSIPVGGEGKTWIEYSISQYDPATNTSYQVAAGGGFIPNSDLTGSGLGTMVLRTNTSRPDFNVLIGPSGPIDVTWHKYGMLTFDFVGTMRSSDYTGVFQVTNGRQTSSYATVEGTVVGFPIGPLSVGFIGRYQNATIVVQLKPF